MSTQQPGRPIIIDVEASGFGSQSYPIEIGLALDDASRFCSLITPPPDWTYWDQQAQQVHQIDRDSLFTCGRSPREVAGELNRQLRGKTVYTDGWVVDKPWIIRLFHQAGLDMEFFVSSLEMILTEFQMECWELVKQEVLQESQLQRHRASHDAWLVQETWSRTRAGCPKQNS